MDINVYGRTKGHSAAACAAYRCGIDLVCCVQDKLHRYSRRKDEVLEWEIVGGQFDGPQHWADAIEDAEHRADAQLCRDLVVGLPAELPLEAQLALARAWADRLAAEYGTAIVYAVHKPSKDGDKKNVHMHALMPTRRLAACGAEFQVPGKIQIYRSAVRQLTADWNALQHAYLRRYGKTAVLRPPCPRIHLGKEVIALERREASKRDEAAAKKAGRPYQSIRRSVPDLLTYTKGVTVVGKAWLSDAAHIAVEQERNFKQEPEPASELGFFEDPFELNEVYEPDPEDYDDVPRRVDYADDLEWDSMSDSAENEEADQPKSGMW